MEKDKILETVVDNLDYIVQKDILVKPLDKIKFTKKVSEPVATGKKDKEGLPKYEIKEVEKEVTSEFTLGIIIAMPAIEEIRKGLNYKEGDTIVYCDKFAKDFDLFKTSQLVKPYDVIAVKK